MINYSKNAQLAIVKITLFTLWPFLSFYAQNIGQSPSLPTLISIFVAIWLTIFSILFFMVQIKHKNLRRVSDVLAIFVVMLFQYAIIKSYFLGLELSTKVHHIAWVLITAISCIGVYRFSKREELSKALFAMGCVLILLPIGQIALSVLSPVVKSIESSDKVLTYAPKIRPNIYYIVLDGYSRADFLRDYFEFDNSRFIENLEELGFLVASNAQANYPLTHLSISSTLQMDYLLTESEGSPTNRKQFYKILGGNNRLVAYLKKYDYQYVHFENGIWGGTNCGGNKDICLNESMEVLDMNETAINFLSLSPLFSFINKVNEKLHSDKNKKALNALQILKKFAKENLTIDRKPFFLFAHTIPPHPPMRYFADCNYGKKSTDEKALTKWSESDYLSQIKCVNHDVIDLMSFVLENDKTKPIIILNSDHGSATRDQFQKNLDDWDSQDLQERFFILNSIFIPDDCSDHFTSDVSPVNTFRIVTACIQGVPPRLLKNRSYLTTYESFPDYGKVQFIDQERFH